MSDHEETSEQTNTKSTPAMADTIEEPTLETHPSPIEEMANGQNNMNNSNKNNSSNVSEYDSAEETYSDRENGSVSGTESEGSVTFEREEGDGQESTPAKKVDDDEDKKNPQYIPKRGTFYEHDDRTADDIETPEAEKTDKESKKKVWQDKKEKWNHDRFNDMDQTPKSRAELVAIYGYDIRNEDGPPRARRRRRYGRGPNKYTRNWEDEDAYGKPTVIRKPTIVGNKKGRPKSEESNEDGQEEEEIVEKSENAPREVVEQEKEQRLPVVPKEETKPNPPPPPFAQQLHQQPPQYQQSHQQHRQQREIIPPKQNISNYQNERQYQSNKNNRVGTGRVSKPKRELNDSDYSGFTKSRQFKSTPNTRIQNRNTSHNTPNQNNIQELEKDMNRMSMQEGPNYKSNKHSNSRQGSMPPRLQAEQKGSKRYSSIRQRSLPETNNPPFPQQPQHGNYYPNEFTQQNQTQLPQPPQPQLLANNTILPPTAQLQPTQIPPQTLPPIPQQVPIATTPILQAPPQFAPPFTPAPPFLQPPGVPPTSFIPQQTASILNYVQGQPQFPQYQGYQQPFNAVAPPTELYQPQGGITYYSPQEQQATQRAAPLKRPKVAIPIVAPPEHRGRGRTSYGDPSVVNNENYDNQNIITGIAVEHLEQSQENSIIYEDVAEIAAQ